MLYSKLFTDKGTIEVHIVREYEDRDGGDNLEIQSSLLRIRVL